MRSTNSLGIEQVAERFPIRTPLIPLADDGIFFHSHTLKQLIFLFSDIFDVHIMQGFE
jgi:hypothetical protein